MRSVLVAVALTASAAALPGQEAGPVTRLDPALDAVVPANARVEKVATGFGVAEAIDRSSASSPMAAAPSSPVISTARV
jgi:hypothetical protein